MTNVDALVRRIDQEMLAEVNRKKAAWEEVERENRERGARLDRFDRVAGHLVELLKPRMDAFLEHFKPVVKATPEVGQHARGMHLELTSTRAKVTLVFAVLPDVSVTHVRLESTIEIVPVWVPYDKQANLEFPLDAVPDDRVVEWFDNRVVAFVKAYLGLVRQDDELLESLKDYLVEDPVAKIRFPHYLAGATLQRDGRTWYFVDESTRRQFEQLPAAKT
jgi:hypothetical protein